MNINTYNQVMMILILILIARPWLKMACVSVYNHIRGKLKARERKNNNSDIHKRIDQILLTQDSIAASIENKIDTMSSNIEKLTTIIIKAIDGTTKK